MWVGGSLGPDRQTPEARRRPPTADHHDHLGHHPDHRHHRHHRDHHLHHHHHGHSDGLNQSSDIRFPKDGRFPKPGISYSRLIGHLSKMLMSFINSPLLALEVFLNFFYGVICDGDLVDDDVGE